MISDIGGLIEGLFFFANLFVGLYTLIVGNPLTEFLTSSLFKRDMFDDTHRSGISRIASRPNFLSQKFTFLRDRKEKRMLEKAKARTNKQLEIDHVLRTQMQVKVILRTIFTKAERFLLQNNKMFIMHSESSSDSSDNPDSIKHA